MIYLKYFFVIIIVIILIALPAEAGLFGPSNYDECIIESMKGVTSDVAAKAIIYSCRERFQKIKKLPPSKSLSFDQIMRITGRAGLRSDNYYGGNLYNGNSDVDITEISVNVTTKIGGKEVKRVYLCNVNIEPLTSSSFIFDIIVGDKNADYSWYLVEAKGYKSN